MAPALDPAARHDGQERVVVRAHPARRGLEEVVRGWPPPLKHFLAGVLVALILSLLLALETSSRAFVYVGF